MCAEVLNSPFPLPLLPTQEARTTPPDCWQREKSTRTG